KYYTENERMGGSYSEKDASGGMTEVAKSCKVELFYHLKLRCYVVVELKADEFDPRDAGQMSFCLSAVDDLIRKPEDQPTIGMLLCKRKNRIVVEYALRDNFKPIGVASYETKILNSLPDDLKGSLPTIEELEEEFATK
ncbi:MAG: hypothetical protein KR126chlam3_01679, partial [Chlamydiae bacterium]|nr:hypothetical protein [Chlamydiota bacterium]